MKELVKPEKPGGFLDLQPADFLLREKMINTVRQVFQSFGYDPIETPIVEFTKVLTGEDETSKNIFFVSSRSESDKESLAMRFDHTVPFARFLAAYPYNKATNQGIKLPWRRMVLGPVFRADAPQKGRFRQFYQFDIDIAGAESMLADAEIIAIMNSVFVALDISRFVIRLNNRKILNGLSEKLGIESRTHVSKDDITKEIFRILDKMDKVDKDEIIDLLCKEPDNEYDPAPNLSLANVELVKEFLEIEGDNQTKLASVGGILSGSLIGEEGVRELEVLLNFAATLGVPGEKLQIDFSVARGLDYYTGPVMETMLLDAMHLGSVFSGGRYDGLMTRFTGQDLPAVGASIGVDRLFSILRDLNFLRSEKSTVSEVMILNIDEELMSTYLKLSNMIRGCGFNVEISLVANRSFKAQFTFAVSRGVDYVLICGQDDLRQKKVELKDLRTREQISLPLTRIVEHFVKLNKS